MPGPILHVGAVANCPHAGTMSIATGEPRVLLTGQPAATMADVYTIAGCPFQVPIPSGTKPQPCVTVRFTTPATRVLANAKPVMLSTSVGICQSAEQIPQGAPIVSVVQTRVIAT
jgi:hypothetical protein